jgi:hypothetical protein
MHCGGGFEKFPQCFVLHYNSLGAVLQSASIYEQGIRWC